MSRYSNLPYRAGVGIMLVNDENKVFVGKRIDTKSEAWQMPQGGIDDGESPREAVLRELLEEVGTDKVEIIAESGDWHFYNLPDNLVPKVWGGKYQGQKQKWFLMRFTGGNSDINIQTHEPEFCDWQWVEIDRLLEMVVPFKREIYSIVMQEFHKHTKL